MPNKDIFSFIRIQIFQPFDIFFFLFAFVCSLIFNWTIIALQFCVSFSRTTWISSKYLHQFSSVQFSGSVLCDSLWPHDSQHTRPPCPSPTSRVHPIPCPSSQWCQPDTSSSVVPFSSCPQYLPASGSFPMSQFFTWSDQSIGVSASASVLPINTQDSSSGWTSWISL